MVWKVSKDPVNAVRTVLSTVKWDTAGGLFVKKKKKKKLDASLFDSNIKGKKNN